MNTVTSLIIIAVAVLFIFGIKLLSSPKTARYGNLVAALGMIIAFFALHKPDGTYVWAQGWNLNYTLIAVGILVGLTIGATGAYLVKMTSVPEMVALFNGLGGGAAALVATLEFTSPDSSGSMCQTIPIMIAALIGSVSLTGSVVAYLKLRGKIEKQCAFKGQTFVNGILFCGIVAIGVWLVMNPYGIESACVFYAMFALCLIFGVTMVMPIGGADMPVVISLLNSFTGLAVAADGYAIDNLAMVVAGTLVGSSGTLLTLLMCKAMNRSITNVLFSGFGSQQQASDAVCGEMKDISVEDAYCVLEAARSVVIVPGYGMAVAQAQHAVKELATRLEENGAEVRYAIHPVAGRMPGHMNVLLAEANVPYEQLVPMDDINKTMETVDVAIVIGANDVVNPAAANDKTSPIYGMPIVEAYKARTIFAIKRGKGAGFSGLVNTLYFLDKTRMIYGDAKSVVSELAAAFKKC
jgi:H+-translocating NAD(P) transhydrogenase subunit beta